MDGVLDEIKQRVDIVELIGEYTRLTKAGRNFKARCPFHAEKTASFMVSPERQIWHCFGCGQGGDIFGFVMKIEGMEFGDALRLLARRAGVVLKKQDPQIQSQKKRLYELCELAARFFEVQLAKSVSGQKVLAYLVKRGLSPETIKTWRLGWAPDEWRALTDFLRGKGYKDGEIIQAGLAVQKENSHECYDRFRSRIIFPIFDLQGQVIAFGGRIFGDKDSDEAAKYLNSPQTALYDKSNVLYGLNKTKIDIRAEDRCVLVEGYMDLLMSWQGGVQNVVASSGTALTENQLNIIGRYTKNLAMAFDSDAAGDAATRRSIDLALKRDFDIKVILMKDKDPADVVKKDAGAWRAAVASAESVMEFYFNSIFAKSSNSVLTIDDKKRISRELLPIIKNIPSRVEQSEWLKELTRRLRVEEKDLMADLQQIKVASEPAAENTAVGPLKNRSRLEGLEERFLGLCLNNPQYFQKADLAQECDFQNDKLGQIFSRLKKIAEEKKEDPVSHLRRSLPELVMQIDYISLKIQRGPQDELQVINEIESCLKELKIFSIRRRLTALSFEIKNAQPENNKLKIRDLLEKFSELSSELIGLTNNYK